MMDIVAAENVLQWGDGNGQQTYLFEYPIRRYLELSDSTGIVVVLESPQKWEKNHAVIIDTDGKIRKEIIIPSEIGTYNFSYEYYFIYDVYYEDSYLAFILTTCRGAYDIACLFNEKGEFIRSHLTK
ncbi:MAG: hypothetical protein HFF70_02515 [Oscillospiraceae bacterium]|jgi:hypothetical protein|nr:hypothetical protein [Oscillospiraceae bacterium]